MAQRTKLKNVGSDERHTFTGTFARTGFKSYRNKYSPTLLLKDFKMDGELLTDHLWMNYGKNFIKLGRLHEGDVTQFNGRVGSYVKGYYTEGYSRDYKIERPTKVSLVNPNHDFEEVPSKNRTIIGMILLDNANFYSSTSRGTDDDEFYEKCYKDWKNSR